MIEHIQLIYQLILVFLYSYFATKFSLNYIIRVLRRKGYLVKDEYKKGRPKIPTMAGISMLVGILISISLSEILLRTEDLGNLIIFYFVVIVYALYGVIDDLFAFKKRYDKIIVMLVLTLPIASLITDTNLDLLFFDLEIGILYALLFVPIYIMVVANLINIHAGYNGLSTGLALILIIAVGIKSFMLYATDKLIYLLPVLGALIAFFPIEKYPAKALSGNIGTFLIGSALGCLLVVNNIELFGCFILIPHVVNFLMDTWTIAIKKIPDVKFGKIRKDNTIQAPPKMKYKSLKFLIVTWFNLTEKQATNWLYLITILFCIGGLIIF